MKHIIIGTAGHIDHGKTTLIKALTGRETDTLKEEKERGISINLGFTYFDLPSGKRAGIIDVPGHEKFIKNMLAGVSGIDIVLLVIAADEGVMPQTREHLEILNLLNVQKGIIVLTKTDLVESDFLELVIEDVKSEFKGSFLENSPIIKVSSKNGQGISELINEIDEIVENTEMKDLKGYFRLPVDRVFKVSGFGTVVTGTIVGGIIKEGEEIEICPSKIPSRVRGIEIHDNSVKIGEAGQRCAINIPSIKNYDIKRGDVLTHRDKFSPTSMIDCKLNYLKSAGKPLKNNQRIKLYIGTSEILARVVIFQKDEILEGEWGYVQFRLESETIAARGDNFVIRSYSPMKTIGGGIVIEPYGRKTSRTNSEYIEEIKLKEEGKSGNLLENIIENNSEKFYNLNELSKLYGRDKSNLYDSVTKLLSDGTIIELNKKEEVYLHKNYISSKELELVEFLSAFHDKNNLKIGILKEELKNKVFSKDLNKKYYDDLLEYYENKKVIKIHNNFISLYDFKINLSKFEEELYNKLINSYKSGKFQPPKLEEIEGNPRNLVALKKIHNSMIEWGEIIKLSEDCFLLIEQVEEAKEIIKNYIMEKGAIEPAEGRQILNTNRKYSIAILEYLDTIKVTKRVENKRILV